MFLVNSRLGLFSAAISGSSFATFTLHMALLLPKLRSHFAEFLSGGSPVPLSTLMPAYLCRFAERPLLLLLSGFSRQCSYTPSIVTRTISTSRLTSTPVYFNPRARLPLVPTKPAVGVLNFLRHHLVITK